MPIHVTDDTPTAANIDTVTVGNVVIARAYVAEREESIFNLPLLTNLFTKQYKASLVYEYDPLQVLTLTSAEDLNLATWLGTQGANPAKPIIINFAEDQVIGATSASNPALDFGDLSAYTGGITFNINGQIQGAQGGDAMYLQDDIQLVSTGEIAGEVETGITSPDAAITVIVSATGKILAGGGNGGTGGTGGYGTNIVNISAYRGGWNTGGTDYWRCPVNGDLDWLIIRWDGVNVVNTQGWNRNYKYRYQSGGWSYLRGSYGVVNENSGAGDNDWWNLARGNYYVGTRGNGGGGGVGAGYNQSSTPGTPGGSGSYRAGRGGQGGAGGSWGQDGETGFPGGTGYYYTYTNSSQPASGTGGTAGTSAGKAIVSTASVLIYGAGSAQATTLGL